APAAAWLATGLSMTAFGPPASSPVRLDLPSPRVHAEGLDGEVLRADRFGNLTTNIDQAMLATLAEPVSVHVAGRVIPRVVATYSEAGSGELCALVGSSERLELAVSGGSAAATLGVGRGAVV